MRRSTRIALAAIGAVLLVLALVLAWNAPVLIPPSLAGAPRPVTTTSGTAIIDTARALRPGMPAPDFVARSLAGGTAHLSDYRGQLVLVNFWASWCVPCRDEMPLLQTAFAGGRVVVLGVNALDLDEEPAARSFVADLHVTFPVLFDEDGAIQRAYSVRGLPTSVLVAPDGTVKAVQIGPLSAQQLEDYLK